MRRSPEFRRIFRTELRRLRTLDEMERSLGSSAFKEREKVENCYRSKQEHDPHQHSQSKSSSRDYGSNFKEAPPQPSSSHNPFSHHYSVLGLDRQRETPYTEKEIKDAFRVKAKEYHPDLQKEAKKEFAESKFKQVMVSYEAIKVERGIK